MQIRFFLINNKHLGGILSERRGDLGGFFPVLIFFQWILIAFWGVGSISAALSSNLPDNWLHNRAYWLFSEVALNKRKF